ncbi:MAG: hypothetical protein OXU71_12730 [Gammaproteobacteria bacterium]|nr:hypothetical protein [Gammaproteobacteria bacterium]
MRRIDSKRRHRRRLQTEPSRQPSQASPPSPTATHTVATPSQHRRKQR